MNTTFIDDGQGNLVPCPQSHKSTRDFINRIAEEKIKAFNLPDTVEEYLKRCEENNNPVETMTENPPCENLAIIPAKRRG